MKKTYMKKQVLTTILALIFLSVAVYATPHLIPLQGWASDSSGKPINSGDISVRIYDAATGGNLIYDSGTDFDDAIEKGVYDIVLGSITPLDLDNTKKYYMEMDINGEEVVGDATTGREAFWPGSGDHTHIHDDRYYTESESDSRFVNTAGDTMTGNLNIDGDVRGNRFLDYSNTNYLLDPANTGNSLLVAGNVGIGTTSPGAKLDVEVSSGGAATIGSSGNSATGNYAIAMGYNTNASGHYSTAMGSGTTASGYSSTAMGRLTTASGYYSTAMGYGTTASGYYSTAMGYKTTASGSSSTAMGYFTTASGSSSTAMGREIEAEGDYSVAIGLDDMNGLTVTKPNTMAIMGGNVGIGTVNPSEKLEVNGNILATPIVGKWYPTSTGIGAGYWQWDVQEFNTDTDYFGWTAGATAITIKKLGYYQVCANLMYSALASGDSVRTYFYHNTFIAFDDMGHASGQYKHTNFCVVRNFAAGDEVKLYNPSSGNDRYGGSTVGRYSQMTIYKLN